MRGRMSVPIIRAATEADIPVITAIYAHAVRFGTATFEIDPPGDAEMARRLRDLAGFPYLVAEFDGRVRGCAGGGRCRASVQA